MADLKGDRNKKKRSFINTFAETGGSKTTSSQPSSTGADEIAPSPDQREVNVNKRSKNDAFSSPSASPSLKTKQEDNQGFFLTPPPVICAKHCTDHCPSSSSSSPYSTVCTQNSTNSVGSKSSGSHSRISDSTATGHEDFSNLKEDVAHQDSLDLIVARRLFERPTIRGVFDPLKAHLEPILLKRLKELSESEPNFEVDLEMADSLYLLKLISCSNPKFEAVGKKAGRGAMLLMEGVRLVTEGKDILRSVIADMSDMN